jgi:molecular chaperone GrpE
MNQVNSNESNNGQEEMMDNDNPINNINTDENVAGTIGLDDAIAEESLLEKLRMEVDEQKDKYLRLFAEFDNFKRRTAVEKNELRQTAGREIIASLLDVLDDRDRTEKVLEDGGDFEALKQGVALVFHKFRSALEQKGLKSMSSVNKEFDADIHEAITEIPAPSDELKGKVIDEVQKGYMLGEKIIRYAKVVVGK